MNIDNKWIVRPDKKPFEDIPDKSYVAEFVGVEDFTLPTNGEMRWKWKFKVAKGEHTNKVMDCLTDMDISSQKKAGKIIRGLLSRELVVGENVKASIDECQGKVYLVVKGKGSKGGKSCVQSVDAVPEM